MSRHSLTETIERAAFLAALCARHSIQDAEMIARSVAHLQRIAWQCKSDTPREKLGALQSRAAAIVARMGPPFLVAIERTGSLLFIDKTGPYDIF